MVYNRVRIAPADHAETCARGHDRHYGVSLATRLREKLRVLSVGDDGPSGTLIFRVLEREGFDVTIERVQTRAELAAALDGGTWDVVLSDHSMPAFSSTDAMRLIKGRGIDLPFIIVSGYIGEEAAVAAMREGAQDYVPKLSLGRLGVAVRRALGDAKDRAAHRQRERDLEALHAVAFKAGTSLDAARLAEFATERARELLGADAATLTWWDEDAQVLRKLAGSEAERDEHLSQSPDAIKAGTGLSGIVFERREPIVVDDYERWPQRIRTSSPYRSAMAVPLFVGERVVGALFVGSIAPRRFAPEEVRVLSLLGAEVAPAIEASRLLADAQRAASFDALTGLPNRAEFARRLATQIGEAQRSRTTFAILYADLDDFREVNDAFGHDAGDAVLREFGERLKRFGGLANSAARFGADEFVVCLPQGGETEARAIAERAPEFFSEPFTVGDQLVHITASIGIVLYPDHGPDAETLLRHAEVAMLAAKRSQTRYAVYAPSLDPQSHRRITLASELRHAMRGDELLLHYQPQVDMRTGVVLGVEALLRWRHPVRGIVPPVEFIPVAEQTGLIIELTPWVIQRALAQLAAWHDGGMAFRVSVNLSMRNLGDPRFLDTLAGLVRDSSLPPDALVLEITEGTIMLEAERTLDVLGRIRSIGIGIAIDDFGTGYSSLSYLSRLPVDEVKIDKSFVMALEERGNRAIVSSVIRLGDAFGLRVVAEGVKDEASWVALSEMGCPIAQGFHLSPPIPPADIGAWVRARESSRPPT